MNGPRLAAIVHGARWPLGDAGAQWRDRLARALHREVEIVLARDEVASPRGAAACMADGLARTMAPHVLVVDVHAAPDDDLLRALVAALSHAALVAPRPASVPPPRLDAATGDALTAMQAAAAGAPPTFDDPAIWAVDREMLVEAGGLDASLWSLGVFEDVAATLARRGARIERLDLPPVALSGESYPLAPPLATFLRWRNRLRLTLRHAPPDRLGPALLTPLVALLSTAWAATGIDGAAVSFGGDWGRASIGARLRTRLGGPPPDDVWPADEVATVTPLAALHACALELPDLVHARHVAGLSRPPTPPRPPEDPVQVETGVPLTRPRLSIIIVNWNGREHLETCVTSLQANDYPRDLVEVICVDNGSHDDSRAYLAEHFPHVRVVALAENRGFTGGNAAGVEVATGDVLVFVNNDMRFPPDFLSRLVDGLDASTACVGARVMNWDGSAIDFVRGTASFEARGYQELFGASYVPGMSLAESFFPNGGAFAITRRAYDDVGGFDPALFAYYDDVDLGWRLRMAGHRIRTVPDAVVQHRHGSTVRTQPHAHKRFLLARNALRIALRNYDDHTLPHVMPAVLLLAGLRVAQDMVWLRSPLRDLLRPWLHAGQVAAGPAAAYVLTPSSDAASRRRVLARLPMPELAAIGAVLEDLPRLADVHRDQQTRRRVPDTAVLPFLGRPFDELDGRRSYRHAQKALMDALALRARLGIRPHVLLITHEALRANMSGPAIRVLEMGRALARGARVTVCAPVPSDVRDDAVTIVPFDPASPTALAAQAETADVVIVQGFALTSYPLLTRLFCPIVADVYCPFTLEHLEQHRASGVQASIEADASAIRGVQNAQLQQADFFICASERQRDFWLGNLHALGRVNTHTLGRDATLRSLVDVVPFGLPSEPIATAADRARRLRVERGDVPGVLKGVHPAVRETDRVLLWGGSLLDWQDPETLIEAVARLTRDRDDVKLFFMGVRHPNPQVAPMAVVARSRALAERLGIADTHVIFNDWVPYQERALYLLEADLGVSTHHAHLETRYAFRTRMLDYLWAQLPIVCTEGDHFGDLVGARQLGRAVPPGDPDALAAAIGVMLDDEEARRHARSALADVAATMTWDRVVEPLRRYCADPAFAADREPEMAAFHAHLNESFKASRWLKRTALRLGVKEGDVEALKRWGPVRAGMTMRNVVAYGRARRKARQR